MSATRIILFLIVAGLLLWGGVAYNRQEDTKVAAERNAAAEAEQKQQQDLFNKMKIEDIKVGTGATVANGDTVSVQYTGTLTDGTKFDSSYDHGGQPFEFTIGQGNVIKGWELGLIGMKVGGKRNLNIPAELAYGARAVGPIPANSPLNFAIELVGIKGK